MPFKLIVTSTETPGAPRSYVFNKEHITIGRSTTNDLPLYDPRRLVSTRHAEIRCDAGCHVIDLGSKNYTFLNGERLHPGQIYDLNDGDALRIGAFDIAFHVDEQARTAAPDANATIAFEIPTTVQFDAQPPTVRTLYETLDTVPPERREDTLRQTVEKLALLNELTAEIGAAEDPKAIMDRIVETAMQAVGAAQGLITLVDEKNEQAAHTFIRKMNDTEERFHVNQHLLGWMQEHKKPLRLNDAAREAWDHGIYAGISFQSVLCVPLMTNAAVTGILTVCNKKNPSGFTEEDERLLAIMAGQSAQILETARLKKEQQRLLRVHEEMRLAFDIQTNLLPKKAPVFPGYELAGTSLPAQTVGGDYFDYIRLDDHRVALCVGDAVGKGLPASLLMANTQATLRGQTPWASSVKECLERSNKLLYESTKPGAFVTLVYGILNTHTHTFRYANAGHNRPLLLHPGEEPVELSVGGLVLGAVSSFGYEEDVCAFRPGGVLLLFSDGITEAFNAHREQFGDERLARLLKQHVHLSAQDLVDTIIREVCSFVGDEPQTDDMTLVVAKRVG